MLTPTSDSTLGLNKKNEKQAQKTNIFFIVRRNYKRTRGHKRSGNKFSLHVNNRELLKI